MRLQRMVEGCCSPSTRRCSASASSKMGAARAVSPMLHYVHAKLPKICTVSCASLPSSLRLHVNMPSSIAAALM